MSEKSKLSVELISAALLFASSQWGIGSVSMSSSFSCKNFSKDQVTLNRAAAALREYLVVGVIWAVIVSVLMYYSFGTKGLVVSLILNFVIIAWMIYIYNVAFTEAACMNKLKHPGLFFASAC